MTEPTTSTARNKKKKRNLILGAVIGLLVVLAVSAGIGLSLANQPQSPAEQPEKPAAAATPSTTPTETPAPPASSTPTSTPTPTASAKPVEPAIPVPDDCKKIYTPEFLALWDGQPLNDPSLAGVGISRYETVEKTRKSLPGIECKWGEATEGGMSNAVNRVTSEQRATLIKNATAEGFSCVDSGAGTTVCGVSVGPTEGDEWVIAEELYFRDGVVVTTWRASTTGSIADSSQPVYSTLWP